MILITWTEIIPHIGSIALAIIALVYMWEKFFDTKRYKEEMNAFLEIREQRLAEEQQKNQKELKEANERIKELELLLVKTNTNYEKIVDSINEGFKTASESLLIQMYREIPQNLDEPNSKTLELKQPETIKSENKNKES